MILPSRSWFCGERGGKGGEQEIGTERKRERERGRELEGDREGKRKRGRE